MDGGLKIKLDIEEGENRMSKALKIQVLAFENKDEVMILIHGLKKWIDTMNDMGYSSSSIQTAKDMLNELIKINAIFENTNNN